ncbi:hypothetical protein EYC80_004163 [Monilinia laxa]|uniref:Uncharacterized protein n=1 Tax=Monilinia laxa TaxID=61186 RepID=A0A5N6KLY9_MONLA|nr:hypothetical protein EYC80_004163 [Monilinia laxa]
MLRTISNSLNPLFRTPKKSLGLNHFEGEEAQNSNIKMSSPKDITLSEFSQTLARYPTILNKYSKDAKDGVTPLQELDKFRYVEAPARFKDGSNTFTTDDILKLVEWKLRHGAYRPGFLKKVAKNTDETVEAATKDAFSHYKAHPNEIDVVINKLKEPLMGIGPATASLILSVYDPEHVTFFSDEVFKWLVNDGEHKPTPKYSVVEFQKVHAAAKTLAARLRVNPLQIEKVAFVIIKESEPVFVPKERPAPSGRGRGRPAKPDSEKKVKPPPSGRGRGRPASGIVKPKPAPKPAKEPKVAAPKAQKAPKSPKIKAPTATAETKTAGKRGRPAKVAVGDDNAAAGSKAAATPGSAKKRGRPAKEEATPVTATPDSKKRKSSDDVDTPVSAGRGRPKKVKA